PAGPEAALFTAVPAAFNTTPANGLSRPTVRTNLRRRVSMTSTPLLERSPRKYSPRTGLTKLISNDVNGNGSTMAVKHRVCVFVGAPGPVQGSAIAIGDIASDRTPSKAEPNPPERYEKPFNRVDISSFQHSGTSTALFISFPP